MKHSIPWNAMLLLALASPALARAEGPDDTMTDVADLPETEIETLRRQAESQGDFDVAPGSAVHIDRGALAQPWRTVPFVQDPLTYNATQMEREWSTLMRVYGAPWPSESYLQNLYARYPSLLPDAAGDPARHARDVQEAWRLFFRGDFQAARRAGDAAGFAGSFPGFLSQIMYALYLEPDLVRKHMLLQDVADRVATHAVVLKRMKKDPAFHREYALMRLLHVYALGRIAEDIPVTEALRRGYAFKVVNGVDDFTGLQPEHALSPALQSGVDANVVRKVGKAMGRITFGAKQARVRAGFEATLLRIPDSAVVRYEYANALLFIDRKRGLELALAELQRAAAQKPYSALEALDAMYAMKRYKELQSLRDSGESFRGFERKRMRWQAESGINLFCVTCPPFLVDR